MSGKENYSETLKNERKNNNLVVLGSILKSLAATLRDNQNEFDWLASGITRKKMKIFREMQAAGARRKLKIQAIFVILEIGRHHLYIHENNFSYPVYVNESIKK